MRSEKLMRRTEKGGYSIGTFKNLTRRVYETA